MGEIDHSLTPLIVCPYCGRIDKNSIEESSGEEDLGVIECGTCFESFRAERIILIQYSTWKV